MPKKLFVLDTNILIHDPTSLYHFQEHDIFIPMMVLEELDSRKTGISEVARNVRQANRMLVNLLQKASHQDIVQGLPIINPEGKKLGRLFFQTSAFSPVAPEIVPCHRNDNVLLGVVLGLQKKFPLTSILLVSKDIHLRIKASVFGINAEDYFENKILDDIHNLRRGLHILKNTFWEKEGKGLKAWQKEGQTFYQFSPKIAASWNYNDCISTEDNQFQALVKEKNATHTLVQVARDYTQSKAIWGVQARNREQNFALNVLLDPNIDFVSLQGPAGTGKTLLTIAAGLTQVLEQQRYNEIIMTRTTIPVGEDIGFLPGTEEEKMTPWMGALLDNLEVLQQNQEGGHFGRGATKDLLQSKIKIRSLNFMRGRTFLHRYIILDEAQNLTVKQIKTLVTRAGPGSKIICLGDIQQIDTPYLTETTSGLTYAIDRFQHWQHSAHITLTRGERSRLAEYAAEHL